MATDTCCTKGLSDQAKIPTDEIQSPRGVANEGNQIPAVVTGTIKDARGSFQVK